MAAAALPRAGRGRQAGKILMGQSADQAHAVSRVPAPSRRVFVRSQQHTARTRPLSNNLRENGFGERGWVLAAFALKPDQEPASDLFVDA